MKTRKDGDFHGLLLLVSGRVYRKSSMNIVKTEVDSVLFLVANAVTSDFQMGMTVWVLHSS